MTKHDVSKRQDTSPAKREETRTLGRMLVPAVDIFESSESLTLIADLPGVDKNGLDINTEKGVLTINGTVTLKDRGRGILREFSSASYYRQFKLPDELNTDKSYAELRDGVLILRIPKTDAAMPKRIEIRH